MLAELGLPVSPVAVARDYDGLMSSLCWTSWSEAIEAELATLGLNVVVTDTIMRNDATARGWRKKCWAW